MRLALTSRSKKRGGVDVARWRGPRLHRGAILPLFAVLLPVLLILAGFAINVAYMQLSRTELKVATDAAARAGGRAFSEYQDVDQALAFAQQTAASNRVAGKSLILDVTDNSGDVIFGNSSRLNAGYGRYTFVPRDTGDVRAMRTMASSLRVRGQRTLGSSSGAIRLPFPIFGSLSNFQPVLSSVATQVDRDIALILDRSGSMCESMYDWTRFQTKEMQQKLVWNSKKKKWENKWVEVTIWNPPEMEARASTYNSQYNNFMNNGGPRPDDSRWAGLERAVDAFFDVLEATDQGEQVSVASFSSSARLEFDLMTSFNPIRNMVNSTRPSGMTSIGAGMQTGFPTLIGSFSRPYAAKTIVVLTDGINNSNPTPQSVATTVVVGHNVTIHTVTLSDDADQSAMQQVASIGKGKHYHAEDVNELVEIFREIANNLPTIITQ